MQQFLDLTAARGGWPVAGITMHIKDNKAVDVMINGKPLDPNATYTTANSDFVANGGDNADMLRQIPQLTNGYLMRDALVEVDEELKSLYKPYNTEQEFASYVYPPGVDGKPNKEQPVDLDNHGLDALRYGVMYLDGKKQRREAGSYQG